MWKIRFIAQITTASISFIASTSMALMIARSKPSAGVQHDNRIRVNRNTSHESSDFALVSSPYHRIIFGLSIADMFHSLAMITGPFMAVQAANTPAKWAIGNIVSCRINGLWFLIGLICSNLYTCFLCYFCFCKVVRKTTDASFRKQTERKIHSVILFITVAMSVAALVSKGIHTNKMGNMCGYGSTQAGCRADPETYGACDKDGRNTQEIIISIVMIVLTSACFVCFVIIITLMTNICCYVKRTSTISGNLKPSNNHIEPKSTFPPVENGTNEFVDLEHLAAESEYRKQIMIQASLYVIAYMATNFLFYAITLLVVVLETANENLSMVASFVYPLGGLFNILVYTRPKVIGLRRVHPKYSWLEAFIFVVRAGGVMPAMAVSDTDSKDEENLPRLHDESGKDSSQLGYSGLDSLKIPSSSLGMNLSSGIFSSDTDGAGAVKDRKLLSRKFYDVAEDIDRALETFEIPATTRSARLDAEGIVNSTTLPFDEIAGLGPLHSSELGAIAEEESRSV